MRVYAFFFGFFALWGCTFQHPLFYRIVWLVHPLWCRIVAVASVLGGASQLQGLSLVFSRRSILLMVGWLNVFDAWISNPLKVVHGRNLEFAG